MGDPKPTVWKTEEIPQPSRAVFVCPRGHRVENWERDPVTGKVLPPRMGCPRCSDEERQSAGQAIWRERLVGAVVESVDLLHFTSRDVGADATIDEAKLRGKDGVLYRLYIDQGYDGAESHITVEKA